MGLAVVFVLYATGVFSAIGLTGFSAVEGLVSLLALVPVVTVAALIWLGIEVVSSLRRIEAAIAGEASMKPEFTRGS